MTATLSPATIDAIANAVAQRIRADRRRVHTIDEPIPTTCSIADLERILQLSKWSIYVHMKDGSFPIPEIEPRIGHPRFSGEMVRAYIAGRALPARARRTR